METFKLKRATFLIFSLALLLRVYQLNIPYVEPYNSITRQSIGASIAQNFYQNGFNFFYPEINENGTGPYLFPLEMQFNTYLTAIGYKITGGVHDWVGRLVSVLFSMGTLFFLYQFGRRLYDETFALAAVAFAALSPLNLALSRSIQPESMMLCASVGALYTFYRYQTTSKNRYYLASVLWMFIAIGCKIYMAYHFLLIFYMAWVYQGRKAFKDYKNYLYCFLASIAFIYYAMMWRQTQTLDLAYQSYHFTVHRAGAGMNYWQVLTHLPFLKGVLKIFIIHLVTPVGMLFFLMGFLKKVEDKRDSFILVWLAVSLLFTAVFLRTVIQHPYYQLSLVPACSFFVARGFCWAISDLRGRRWMRSPVILTGLVLAEFMALFYFYRGLYSFPRDRQAIVDAGRVVQKISSAKSLIIATYGGSPIQLYYCNRKGWSPTIINKTTPELIEMVEKFRREGAEFFALSSLEDFKVVPKFERYLRDRYPVVAEEAYFLVLDLRQESRKPGAGSGTRLV